MSSFIYNLIGCVVNKSSLIGSFFENKSLIMGMIKRDVLSRYKGTFAGLLWSFVTPLLMLVVYTFVFGFIFKARWGEVFLGQVEFAFIIFPGLMVHGFFSDCVGRASTLIVDNSNYVKKVVFPLDALAWVVVGGAFFQFLVSMLVLFLFMLIILGGVPGTFPMFLIVSVVFIPVAVGAVWIFSSLGVYVRDIRHGVGVLITAMLFVSPILYPLEMAPESIHWALHMNPLTVIVQQMQNVLIWGRQPDWLKLFWYLLASCSFAKLSFMWFQRTRKGFADVL